MLMRRYCIFKETSGRLPQLCSGLVAGPGRVAIAGAMLVVMMPAMAWWQLSGQDPAAAWLPLAGEAGLLEAARVRGQAG